MKLLKRKLYVLGALMAIALVFGGCSADLTPAGTLTAADDQVAQGTSGWTLVWSDEFDQPSLDLTNWDFDLGDGSAVGIPGWGNGELQYYTNESQNVSLRDGRLVIRAIEEFRSDELGDGSYTSARIVTRGLHSFQYGRIEARIQMPSGQGLWPAFWMLPEYEGAHASGKYGGWAASGEIDIVEVKGSDTSSSSGAIHYGGEYPNNTYSSGYYRFPRGRNPGSTTSFNDYAIEWEPTEIRWYVNGNLFFTANNWYSDGGEYPAPFDQPFHILLNVAVGGLFDGDPQPGASYFPAEMVVEYVRVYEAGTTDDGGGTDDGTDDGSTGGGPPAGRGPNA